MTDIVTSFIDVDDDFDMMQFHVSEDEGSAASDWPPGAAQVDWDWASKATTSTVASTTTQASRQGAAVAGSSGFLNCWREGPLPDIFNLDDDVLTPVPESAPAGSPDSQSDDDASRLEVKRSPRSTTSRRWTDAEILALKEAVTQYGTGNWKSIQTDPRYASLLGDRVRSSLHRKWSRIKAKSLKDGAQVNLTPGSGKSSARPIPMPTSTSHDLNRPSSMPPSRSPFHAGSWSYESSQPLENRNAMAQSLPPHAFQFQFNERPQPQLPRTPSVPMGFQPGSAPHRVHMAVCVDPSAPPPSPFVPPKSRYSSSFAPGSLPASSQSFLSGLSSSLPMSHGLNSQPMGSPSVSTSSGFGSQPRSSQPLSGSFGVGLQPMCSQSLPKSHLPLSQSLGRSPPIPIPDGIQASKSRRWTSTQAQVLVQAVSVHGESRWRDILNDDKFAAFFAGRSPQSLVRKWNRIQSNSAKHLGAPVTETPGSYLSQPHQKDDMEFEDDFLD